MAVDYEEGRRLLAEHQAAVEKYLARTGNVVDDADAFNDARIILADWLWRNAEALLNPEPWRPIGEAPKDVLIDIWIDNGNGSGVRWAGCHYDQICDQWRQNTPGHSVKWVPAKAVTHFCLPPDPPTHFRELKGPGQ